MTTQPTTAPLELSAQEWVEDQLRTQPKEVLFAQLLHPALSESDPVKQRAKLDEFASVQPGGGFQGGRPSWREFRSVFLEAAERCAIPPIISGDYECRVAIREGVSCGAAMNVGAVADLEHAMAIAYEVGKSCAIQGRAIGTRWTFAPVADVNLNPENPITNVRAFGDDPARVAALVCAFVRGCQEHGMAATLKHFPGDGIDGFDQHVQPTLNPLSLKEWHAVSGRPFREGIAAGAWSVMMGHFIFPALNDRDPASGRLLPATISPAAHRFLREEMGFEGVIVSDAIRMGGVAWHAPDEADASVRNLAAGSDMVLLLEQPALALRAIFRALEEGILDETQLLASVRRILELKTKLGLHRSGYGLLDEENAEAFFADPDRGSAKRLAEASVTLVSDRDEAYKASPEPGDHVLIFDLPQETPQGVKLLVAGQEADNLPEPVMAEALREAGLRATVIRSVAEFREAAKGADAVIYRFQARPQAGRNSIRLAYQALQFIEQTREPFALRRYYVSLGSPYVIRELPALPNFAVTYADVPACERAYVDAMLGKIPFAGRCPVDLRLNE